MLVGYNHNIMYKGEVYHVQTEDSGVNTPHIITLLYRGGNIIASKKTSYADIVKMDNLSQVVEELMKEQHKDMLRRLKNAEFDARLGLSGSAPPVETPGVPAGPAVPLGSPSEPATAKVAEELKPQPPPLPDTPARKKSLDDLIFDFLSAGDDTH